jgi:hypothetical protein
MSPEKTHTSAKPGDLVVVAGHRVGEHERTGEILAVLGEAGHERYRVRWQDGHESVFRPSSDATIRPGAAKPKTRKKAR